MEPNSVSWVRMTETVSNASACASRRLRIGRGAPSRGATSATVPSLAVSHLVGRGDVHPFDTEECPEERLPGRRRIALRLPHPLPERERLGPGLLSLPQEEPIHEGGQRLGIGPSAHAAHADQRIVRAPIPRLDRDPRKLQDPEEVQVVVLVGRGERHAIELGERPLRFQAQDGNPVPLVDRKVVRVREERALADDLRLPIEDSVDRLKPRLDIPT